MKWLSQWRAISARIDGLLSAGRFLAQTFTATTGDAHGGTKHLMDELNAIMSALDELYKKYENVIPSAAVDALIEQLQEQTVPSGSGHQAQKLQVLAHIAMFQSRFEYLIRDTEEEARSTTDLAFEHLRRLIAVDENIRRQWQAALKAGEVACERLGAAHLLGHGIWAFKIGANDSTTDLIFNEPVDVTIAERTARALVLTEWKVVRDPKKAEAIAATARKQTHQYAAGALSDIELKKTRYVALVGEKNHHPLQDAVESETTFRHIWIAVNPDVPSVAARKAD